MLTYLIGIALPHNRYLNSAHFFLIYIKSLNEIETDKIQYFIKLVELNALFFFFLKLEK